MTRLLIVFITLITLHLQAQFNNLPDTAECSQKDDKPSLSMRATSNGIGLVLKL